MDEFKRHQLIQWYMLIFFGLLVVAAYWGIATLNTSADQELPGPELPPTEYRIF